MAARCKISCVVHTLNEEVNLPKCLDSLSWCDDVVVVDSFSTDRTKTICKERKVRFFQHEFTGFGDQRNWTFAQIKFKHQWILILDADEAVPPELATEMNARVEKASDDVAAFRVRRRFYMWGKWLRYSSLYPTWVVRLVRLGRVRYINRGHAETQIVKGRTDALENDLIDENLKGQHDWWWRQNNYSTKEANYEMGLSNPSFSAVFTRDPLKRRETLKAVSRRLPLRAGIFFLYNYFIRRGFLDGREGLRFCLMKSMYLEMIQLKKMELRAGKVTRVAPKVSRRKSA